MYTSHVGTWYLQMLIKMACCDLLPNFQKYFTNVSIQIFCDSTTRDFDASPYDHDLRSNEQKSPAVYKLKSAVFIQLLSS